MRDGAATSQPHPHDDAERLHSLSHILRDLLERPVERLSIGDLVDAFGRRAFGALLFVFGLVNLIPLPPGSSTILSVPLLIIAPQLILGAHDLWLPKALDRRNMRRTDLTRLLDKVLPALERIERALTPRLPFMFGPVGDRLIGLVCFILALVLALPIPGGNFVPALAISALSLGLVARDGLVVLIGYGIAGASAVVLVLSAHAVIAAFQRLIHVFGA